MRLSRCPHNVEDASWRDVSLLPNEAAEVVDFQTSQLARPPRLERGTLCLEGRCSIQLSYGRTGDFPALEDAGKPFQPESVTAPSHWQVYFEETAATGVHSDTAPRRAPRSSQESVDCPLAGRFRTLLRTGMSALRGSGRMRRSQRAHLTFVSPQGNLLSPTLSSRGGEGEAARIDG